MVDRTPAESRDALFADGKFRRFDRASMVCAAGGALLTLLSPLFFLVTFGEPSLIGKQAVDVSVATPARLFSLLFDLNQGMVIGVPGVLLGFGIAAVIVFH